MQFRGSEVIELQNFEPASVEDIANVHARAYISGLEKVAFPPLSSFPLFQLFFIYYSILNYIL